jgi:P27 family predicted phage terminase small subunit
MPRGRKPKPSIIKAQEGNRRKLGRDRITIDAPGIGRPRVPAHLTAEQRKIYIEIIASLPLGILSQADEIAIEFAAVSVVRKRRAEAMIARTGDLVQSPNGPIRNPLHVVVNHAQRAYMAAAAELGLTPAARARLGSMVDVDPDDPMALLLDMDSDEAWSTGRRH